MPEESTVLANNGLPGVSIVVIGHNESKNLRKAFDAIKNLAYPLPLLEVIYVDSNSSDNSLEIASGNADKVIPVRSNWPTAGEAFNHGIVNASHEIVHITGGDICLHQDYLRQAVETLLTRDDIVAVTGYFEEVEETGWSKLISYRRLEDVDESDHYVSTPNGGTFWKKALVAVDGYDERIKKGQEMELGIRFRQQGFKILYKHICQGYHDFDVHSWQQMINRFVWTGKSTGYLWLAWLLHMDSQNLGSFVAKGNKLLVKYGLYILVALILAGLGLYIPAILSPLALHGLMVGKVIWQSRKKPLNYRKYQATMAFFEVFAFGGLLGFICRFFLTSLGGNKLIHHKLGLSGISPTQTTRSSISG